MKKCEKFHILNDKKKLKSRTSCVNIFSLPMRASKRVWIKGGEDKASKISMRGMKVWNEWITFHFSSIHNVHNKSIATAWNKLSSKKGGKASLNDSYVCNVEMYALVKMFQVA